MICLDSQHYDLIVVGGGSGGLACSKEGKKKVSGTIENFLLFGMNLHIPFVVSHVRFATFITRDINSHKMYRNICCTYCSSILSLVQFLLSFVLFL